MSLDMPTKMSQNCQTVQITWNQALIDAKEKLAEAEDRVKRLKATVRGIELKIARNEPLP